MQIKKIFQIQNYNLLLQRDFVEFLKKNYDGKTVAIVAHRAPQLALDVITNNKTWEQALADDWRKTKSWQPCWEYIIQ